MRRLVTFGVALACVVLLAGGAADAQPDKGKLIKMVIVSRHGVRTPEQSFAGPGPLDPAPRWLASDVEPSGLDAQ